MKVGIIEPITRTGEHRYSQYLVEGLRENGVHIQILNNFILNKPRRKVFIGSILLKKIIERENVSILHNLDNLGPYLFKHPNTKTKFILTVLDIAPVVLPHIHNPIIKFDFKRVLPKLISNSDYIITPSHSTKNDLVSKFGVDKNKVGVVPMGIDKSIFYPRVPEDEVIKKYAIYGKYILYVGGDNPRKNLKNLILSYCEISNKVPYNLVLTGPIDKRKVRKIISNCRYLEGSKDRLLSRIIMPGYINDEDLPIIYSTADVFVFPSLYEGFGFPPLEAMACGVPVIVSYNSSLREIVEEAGIYIHNPLDPAGISRNILKVLEDEKLKEELIEKGLNQVKKFNWKKTVGATLEIYNTII